jgi:hypothetical protein
LLWFIPNDGDLNGNNSFTWDIITRKDYQVAIADTIATETLGGGLVEAAIGLNNTTKARAISLLMTNNTPGQSASLTGYSLLARDPFDQQNFRK